MDGLAGHRTGNPFAVAVPKGDTPVEAGGGFKCKKGAVLCDAQEKAGIEAVGGVFDLSKVNVSIFAYVLSLVLFAAVLPLWSAKETLAESKIRERELREHAKRVSKLAENS